MLKKLNILFVSVGVDLYRWVRARCIGTYNSIALTPIELYCLSVECSAMGECNTVLSAYTLYRLLG